ncbi:MULTISPECIES: hypothetical protein [Micromonospora]|uniref:hypothetical protein n=1 Tax=Micromonospora TaxID=1873 RepID=UPI001607E784|nr:MULTISPECIES: hypothetical protein [unclassified Micromonospora]MBU8856081.1 hypothetical protein [Micromonospora sp. WMMB482]MDM4781686.1 hypothetical protein [Micromonospora sp. b486]
MRGKLAIASIAGLLAVSLQSTPATAAEQQLQGRAEISSVMPTPDSSVRPYGECTLIVVCGTVWNFLPSYYSIKVARFGVGTSSCATWNAGTQKCTIYSLPSNKSSKDIGIADADGYTNSSGWYYTGGTKRSANVWTKITDAQSATCVEQRVGAVCTIN